MIQHSGFCVLIQEIAICSSVEGSFALRGNKGLWRRGHGKTSNITRVSSGGIQG